MPKIRHCVGPAADRPGRLPNAAAQDKVTIKPTLKCPNEA